MSCYAIVAGKGASVDGSVLVGHNEQNGGSRFLNFRKVPRVRHKDGEVVKLTSGGHVPQVKGTFAFLWSENPGCPFSDGYLNEWGVAVVSNYCPARGQLVRGGIGYMLRRLLAERAKTARQAVNIAAALIEKLGHTGTQTLVIADPKEAWLLATLGGKRWLARRVGDDQVVLLPNVHITQEVDLKDASNVLGSSGLVRYASANGWYEPAKGKAFDFCEAFAPPRRRRLDLRQWRGQCVVTGEKIKLGPDRQLPFSVTPRRKLAVRDVIDLLRQHGRGAICTRSTQEASVFQLRGHLPAGVGCIYWRTSAEPCTSVLTPWYAGITATPRQYCKQVELTRHLTLEHHFSQAGSMFKPDPKHAWWTFKALQNLVRRDRTRRGTIVRAVWDEFEAKLFRDQPAIEKKAINLYAKDKAAAREYLTDYSRNTALRALGEAQKLIDRLKSGQ